MKLSEPQRKVLRLISLWFTNDLPTPRRVAVPGGLDGNERRSLRALEKKGAVRLSQEGGFTYVELMDPYRKRVQRREDGPGSQGGGNTAVMFLEEELDDLREALQDAIKYAEQVASNAAPGQINKLWEKRNRVEHLLDIMTPKEPTP